LINLCLPDTPLATSSKADGSAKSGKGEKTVDAVHSSKVYKTPSADDAVAKSASTKAEKSTATAKATKLFKADSAKSGKGEKTVDAKAEKVGSKYQYSLYPAHLSTYFDFLYVVIHVSPLTNHHHLHLLFI